MIRKAFVMQLLPGNEEEYRRRHQPIWPELEEVLRKHGVQSYSIFLHPKTLQLFACAEIESEELWAVIATTPECRRWWNFMQDLMASNPDSSPASLPLEEMFNLPQVV